MDQIRNVWKRESKRRRINTGHNDSHTQKTSHQPAAMWLWIEPHCREEQNRFSKQPRSEKLATDAWRFIRMFSQVCPCVHKSAPVAASEIFSGLTIWLRGKQRTLNFQTGVLSTNCPVEMNANLVHFVCTVLVTKRFFLGSRVRGQRVHFEASRRHPQTASYAET